MKVFLDNCTSPVLAQTLNGFLLHRRQAAFHIKDLACGRDARDEDWIAFLERSGERWLILTGDLRIQRNRALREAFRRAQLRGLVFAPAYQKTPVHQQASILIWRWPDLANALDRFEPPFLFELPITKGGKLRAHPRSPGSG